MVPSPTPPCPEWLRELGWAEVYEIRRLIGRGGMGRVYEGWHRALGTRVALKIMDPHLVADDQVRARFEKEAMTLARLQEPSPHPNIVRVLDFKLLESVGCIVMAFVPGVDIRTWCQQQSLSVHARVALLATVARAAGYVHSYGLVHRDLKPQNVLVREETGQPVIVDFGIVRGHEDVTLTRTLQSLGTAGYMAPEQLRTQREEPGSRADVYALGVLLYELLTGELPHGKSLTEVLPRHEAEMMPVRPTRLADAVSRDLERVCLKAISHRPEERYTTGAELAEDLERYLRQEPVQARPASALTQKLRRLKKNPLLPLGLAAGLVFTGFMLWQQRKQAGDLELAELRQQIGVNLPLSEWSYERLDAISGQIELLSASDPSQAMNLHRQLVQGSAREVLATLNEPRLTESNIQGIETTLRWMARHDPAESQRLTEILEGRRQRWETVWHLRPPFESSSQSLSSGKSRVEGTDWVLEKMTDKSHRLNWQRPAPVEIQLSLSPSEKSVPLAGVKARLFKDWYTFAYQHPVPKELLTQLKKDHPGMPLPEAVLSIANTTGYVQAIPIDSTEKSSSMQLRVRIERQKLEFQLNGGNLVEHDLSYATSEPVQLYLIGKTSLRLRELRLSAPQRPVYPSPLEKGDELAGRGEWSAAETAFSSLTGHPTVGQEAAFKTGACQMEQKQMDAARTSWETAFKGPVSSWRIKACFELWKLHTLAGDLTAARLYLDQLPHPEAMPPDYLRQLTSTQIRDLASPYRDTARGIRVITAIPEIEDAIRVHQLLGFNALELCNRFGLARHFNGTDHAANELFYDGLRPPKTVNTLDEKDIRRLCMTLELWSRMARIEANAQLASTHENWLSRLPETHPIRWTLQAEQARSLARQGKVEEARALAAQIQETPDLIGLTVSSAALLRAALGEVVPGDSLKDPVLRAISQLASRPPEASATSICNQIVLHSVARNWTRESLADLLGTVFSISTPGSAQASVQSQLNRFFLEDPFFLPAMNSMLNGKEGHTFLQEYALQTRPSRELIRELVRLILSHHVQMSLFGENPKAPETESVNRVVAIWLDHFAKGQIDDIGFLQLMMYWNQAPSVVVRHPWPRELDEAISKVQSLRSAATYQPKSPERQGR